MEDFLNNSLKVLNQQHQLGYSPRELEEIKDFFEPKELAKGDYLLKEGQYCLHTNLVESGLLMYYQIVDGEEVARDFAMENDWCSYIKSFSQNIPSDMNVRALEPTKVHRLSKTAIAKLFESYPKMLFLKTNLVEQSFIEMAEYNVRLNSLSAEAHYQKIIAEKPEWIQRVPQYYIASYLGIKPPSLSRIWKKLDRK
jgi:CRP-like cAMP-binding protein